MARMRITVFNDGVQNKTPSDVIEDWEDLVDILTYVKEGTKNGKYIVRGFCDGERENDNISEINLIVIDGDSTTTNGASCVPPQQVHKVMNDANVRHIIHTSHSNDLVNSRHKWRMVIPCDDLVDQSSLEQGVREVIAGLHRAGLFVRNVKENKALSQPWFTPRCPVGMADDFYCAFTDGEVYKLTGEITDENDKISVKDREDTGIFSWESINETYLSGSLHQAMLSSIGWLILTTDWADVQIKQFISTQILLCPDSEKVTRALSKKGVEITNLIKHCRDKSGVTVEAASDWRDHHETALSLRDKEFPDVKWAVDGLIPEGLVTIAGDPKVGKSLLAVDICTAISNGGEAFGCQPCVKGSSIYVSMEDPQRRVKSRIMKMVDEWSESFHVITGGVPKLGLDFYKMLDDWIMLWPDTRCIVVDTMSFIIPEKKNGVSDYDHYYSVLDPLHRWALDNGIAVVCITHKKKGTKSESDNPFDGIIGSTAISGCSDAMVMLTKNHAKKGDATNNNLADGFLDVSGREIATGHYSLEFDGEAVRWALRGKLEDKDLVSNSNYLLILDALKSCEMKQKDISEKTGLNINTVKSSLRRMKKNEFLIINGENGWYRTDINYQEVVDGGYKW